MHRSGWLRCAADDSDRAAETIDRRHMVWHGLELPTVPAITRTVGHHQPVQLSDTVCRHRDRGPAGDDKVQDFGISGNLLLIAVLDGGRIGPPQQRFHLAVRLCIIALYPACSMLVTSPSWHGILSAAKRERFRRSRNAMVAPTTLAFPRRGAAWRGACRSLGYRPAADALRAGVLRCAQNDTLGKCCRGPDERQIKRDGVVSNAPSIRVEAPILSMVATRRSASRRSSGRG